MRRAVVVCALLGCGRVAFDPRDDSSGGGGDTGSTGDGMLGDGVTSVGLIGHWPCDDDPSDGVVNEAVGGRTATCSPPLCPQSGLGAIGTSCLFDGTDDSLIVTAPPTFATNAFTIAYWIYFDASATAFDIMHKRHAFGRSWQMTSSSATVRVQYYVDAMADGSGGTPCFMPHGTLTTTWYHAAFTYDAGQMRFYMDGTMLASCTGPATLPFDGAPIIIGKSTPPTFFGRLDDIRMYDRALSTQEIMDLMP